MADLKEGDFVERKDGEAFTDGDYKTQYAYVNTIQEDNKIRLDLVRDPYNLSTISSFHQIFKPKENIKRADDLMADIAAKKAEYNAKRLADALESFNKFKVGQTVRLIGSTEAPPYDRTEERVIIEELAYPSVRVKKVDRTSINVSFSSLKLDAVGGARKQKRKTIRRKRSKRRTYRRA